MKKTFRCKLCGNDTEFASISDLRKHQWESHRDLYKNVSGRHLNAAKIAKKAKTNGHVTAEDLLERLKQQRDFMNDIVDLVEGMLK